MTHKSCHQSGHEKPNHSEHERHDMIHGGPDMAQDFLRRFWIVTGFLVPLLLLTHTGLKLLGLTEFFFRPYIQFVIATIIFWIGRVFFQHAAHEIKAKQYGMMTLVSLGVGSGYLFSALATFLPVLKTEFYLEISTLIWVLLFGHFLEAKSSTAAGDALSEVAKLLPKKAHLIKAKKTLDVPIDQLKKDDIVLIKPGEKVPADGLIIKGSANFNEAHLTGESKPIKKTKDNQAVAGAICLDGSVQIKLNKVGANSTIGQIQALIQTAQTTKPSAQKLADRASKWLTFSALAIAIITLITWSVILAKPLVFAFTLAITVLVIACPHALGLAIPTVSTIAIRLAVKNGLFIKDLSKLEVVKAINYVVFDKTGTLTQGKFALQNFAFMDNLQAAGISKPQIYLLTLSLEKNSSHPIAQAVVNFLKTKIKTKPSPVKNFKNIAGKGIKAIVKGHQVLIGTRKLLTDSQIILYADLDKTTQFWQQQGHTIAYIAINGKHLASFSLSDQVKPESKPAIKNLHNLGVKVAMLTGDSQKVADSVAKKLNIDTVFAEVLPKTKYQHIKKLQQQGNTVIMAGDGVNDAPALTQADVGVALGAGTDVAVEAGDIILTQNNPQDLTRLIILARKVYRKMIENLIWALGYNILAIPAAAGLFISFGFQLRPDVGALLMSLSSVIVVINALALRKVKLDV